MENNNEILEELRAIRKLLTIFAQDQLEAFNKSIRTKYLTSSEREQMYNMFDGTNSFKDIAEVVKITPDGVRKFAAQLESAGLIEYVTVNAKQKNPKKVF